MAGYAIGQNKAYIDNGYLNSYDDVIGSPQHDTNNSQRLPGDYYIVDFNGDGVVDSKDQAPYGYLILHRIHIMLLLALSGRDLVLLFSSMV